MTRPHCDELGKAKLENKNHVLTLQVLNLDSEMMSMEPTIVGRRKFLDVTLKAERRLPTHEVMANPGFVRAQACGNRARLTSHPRLFQSASDRSSKSWSFCKYRNVY